MKGLFGKLEVSNNKLNVNVVFCSFYYLIFRCKVRHISYRIGINDKNDESSISCQIHIVLNRFTAKIQSQIT